MNEFDEGYADGLAGAGLQPRIDLALIGQIAFGEAAEYEEGFYAGSFDRKAMLANAERNPC